MSLPAHIAERLRLPAIAAPMFLVSGVDMVLAACKAGIIGSFPANNARSLDELDAWMATIASTLPADAPPWAMNIMVHRSYARWEEELELVLKHRPPIVITALGSPSAVVDAIQGYGGLVYADVNSLTFAHKAAATGVDGLILVAAGAGGHTGPISGFAFAPAVREWFEGTIALGGGIGSGQAVRAAQMLGADLAYLGTRLIACEESLAVPGYKQMLVEASAEDIVTSAALTGMPANWLKASLLAAGYDAEGLKAKAEINLGRPEDAAKRWRDVWSAGHGAGQVKAVEPLAAIIDKLAAEYAQAAG
ncbi:MAG: 2-nitropropane dioxygenase [Phenylobacterium sp. RIFCSPHIGHO2_01_FULL_69_31]|uniref:NAD(P)H-dependent flavin oxidoreductase n=1 Tax=Phenylobacterium sp. RIFCSPHIGHO2_01_FULL_69_31 TaxID=1801944 RepID=UPI0008C9D32E|nr:nitronate monooxygenase [Phenylobacterium sp. RIFCSPHIGHO2_01_FULL_69_31]OHB28128.1 MAG: 2-nitropropane dioxygenase [Phenylobacterium sp. RIFCSPHIGHO2_01_FULL_69_31]